MKFVTLILASGILVSATASASAPSRVVSRLDGAHDWINGRATASDLIGKVVIVDVFTVDCSNCQNVVPTLRWLYSNDRARGLRVIGIHAPETPAERSKAYVEQSLARQGVVWPVAIDNDFALQEFLDRYGMRLAQLGTILNLVAPLAECSTQGEA